MWIEKVLERKLDRVAAPGELWERIDNRSLGEGHMLNLSLSADKAAHEGSLLPTVAAQKVRFRDNRSLTFAAQKVRFRAARVSKRSAALAWTLVAAMLVVVLVWGLRPRRELVFRSESATQIREWVKTNAGLDVPLLGGAPLVRLTGARLVRGDVEIACRVGNHEARLLVSKGTSSLRHGVQPTKGQNTVAWGMSGRLYALASATPEDLRIACLLCHSSSESRIALN